MQTTGRHLPPVLIIAGPTASGKTALSELIIQQISGEIINADVGQFYVPLSIGTAKPDLSTISYSAHGFDVVNEPKDFGVVAYRSLVTNLIDQIVRREKLPVIVGGSLFYLKSLFFPPHDIIEQEKNKEFINPDQEQSLWQQLHSIDPVRAEEIHPNDEYRINRALSIWQKTGIKPSMYKPILQLPFRAMIVFVAPDRAILNDRIKQRVEIMMQQGWVEETEKMVDTPWESFLQKKGLIGYPELINWIKQGKPIHNFDHVITTIQNETVAYAKRQVTFWKSFAKQLEDAGACSPQACQLHVIPEVTEQQSVILKELWLKFQN